MASKFDSVWVPTLQGAFLTSYEGVLNSQWSTPITRRYDSPGEFLKLVDLGTVGAVRAFSGKRQTIAPIVYTETIQNIPYELTMAIDVEDVHRDNLGMFETKASEMGSKFADHVNKLVITNITTNPICFDGVAFFGSTHPVNGTTQSNDLNSSTAGVGATLLTSNFTSSTSTAPSAVNMANAILSACAYSYTLVDEAGDPINGGAKSFEIVTSNPQIYAAAVAAIDSLQLSQGLTNPLYAGLEAKGFKFLVDIDPRLGASNSSVFWIFRTDSEVKSFVWGEERGLEINYLGDGSYNQVAFNQYIWAAKAVRSVGVGRYQHSFRCTLS